MAGAPSFGNHGHCVDVHALGFGRSARALARPGGAGRAARAYALPDGMLRALGALQLRDVPGIVVILPVGDLLPASPPSPSRPSTVSWGSDSGHACFVTPGRAGWPPQPLVSELRAEGRPRPPSRTVLKECTLNVSAADWVPATGTASGTASGSPRGSGWALPALRLPAPLMADFPDGLPSFGERTAAGKRIGCAAPGGPARILNVVQDQHETGEVPFVDPVASLHALNGKGKKKYCSFCKKNGETATIFTSHQLTQRRDDGAFVVVCPILRRFRCDLCGASGDKAHTRSYCPKATEQYSVAAKLRNTHRRCDGQVRPKY